MVLELYCIVGKRHQAVKSSRNDCERKERIQAQLGKERRWKKRCAEDDDPSRYGTRRYMDLMLRSHVAGNLNKELCLVEAKSDQIDAPRLKRHAEPW